MKKKGAEKVAAVNKKVESLDDQMKREFVESLENR